MSWFTGEAAQDGEFELDADDDIDDDDEEDEDEDEDDEEEEDEDDDDEDDEDEEDEKGNSQRKVKSNFPSKEDFLNLFISFRYILIYSYTF